MENVLEKFKADEVALLCFELTTSEEDFNRCALKFNELYKTQTKGLFIRAVRNQRARKS